MKSDSKKAIAPYRLWFFLILLVLLLVSLGAGFLGRNQPMGNIYTQVFYWGISGVGVFLGAWLLIQLYAWGQKRFGGKKSVGQDHVSSSVPVVSRWTLSIFGLTIMLASFSIINSEFIPDLIESGAEGKGGALLIFGIFLIHAWVLFFFRKQGTHVVRWMIALVPILALLTSLLVAYCYFALFPHSTNEEQMVSYIIAPILSLFWVPGFIVYSMPSRPLALIPLFLHYLIAYIGTLTLGGGMIGLVGFAYLPLAGYLFPKHRRMAEYWRPSRLPFVRRAASRSGLTLIELLIAVAVLAILSAGIGYLVMGMHRGLERQDRWQRAIQLAEDEFALLRAKDQLPALGTHAVEPELRNASEFSSQTQVVVSVGPNERLREVRVVIRMRGEAHKKDLELAAILPVARKGESRP